MIGAHLQSGSHPAFSVGLSESQLQPLLQQGGRTALQWSPEEFGVRLGQLSLRPAFDWPHFPPSHSQRVFGTPLRLLRMFDSPLVIPNTLQNLAHTTRSSGQKRDDSELVQENSRPLPGAAPGAGHRAVIAPGRAILEVVAFP